METDQLVRMTRQGDIEAFNILVERYWRFVMGTVFIYVGNVVDAEDVAQDTFITAYLKLTKLKDDNRFSAWLKAIAVNSARMHLRARKTVPANPNGLFSEDDSDSCNLVRAMSDNKAQPEFEVLQRELSGRIQAALECIPVVYKEVFALKHINELTYKEIADVLDLPSATVAYRLRHANELMRRELYDLMPDEMGDIAKVNESAWIIKDILKFLADGWKLEETGDIKGAESMYDKVSGLAKASPGLHLEVAGRLEGIFVRSGFQERLGERVIKECETGLSLGLDGALWHDGCPVEPWTAHAEMALVFLHLRRFDESKKMFELAKRLGQPYDYNEGNWFSDQGMYDEAIEFYRILLTSHGYEEAGRIGVMCRTNIAHCLPRNRSLDDSLKEYWALIADGVQIGGSWYAIAKIYAQKEDLPNLLEALSNSVKDDSIYAEWAKSQSMFSKYRDMPEFKAIVDI